MAALIAVSTALTRLRVPQLGMRIYKQYEVVLGTGRRPQSHTHECVTRLPILANSSYVEQES